MVPAPTISSDSPRSARLRETGQGQFEISGVVDFDSAADLYHQGTGLFAGASALRVDLAGVSHSNSAALALLRRNT